MGKPKNPSPRPPALKIKLSEEEFLSLLKRWKVSRPDLSITLDFESSKAEELMKEALHEEESDEDFDEDMLF